MHPDLKEHIEINKKRDRYYSISLNFIKNIIVPLNQSVRLGNLHFVVASVNTPDTWDIEITIKDGNNNSIQWLTLNGVFVGQETTEQIPIGNFNIEGHLYGEPTKTVNISPYSGYLSGNTININVSVPY